MSKPTTRQTPKTQAMKCPFGCIRCKTINFPIFFRPELKHLGSPRSQSLSSLHKYNQLISVQVCHAGVMVIAVVALPDCHFRNRNPAS